MQTKKQAQNYAAAIKEATGKTHLVFKVPPGTLAADLGFKFGTCEESERAQYEADGAVFL